MEKEEEKSMIESPGKRDANHVLFKWMRKTGLKEHKLAEAIKSAPRTIYRWLSEGRLPDLDTMQRLHDVTDGEIGLMDWPTDYTREKDKIAAAARRKVLAAQKAKEQKKRELDQ